MAETFPLSEGLDDIRHWPSRRELVAIAAFWLLYGVMSVTNGLFPPGGPGDPLSARAIVGWGLEPLLWMVATPFVFWLTSRYSSEVSRRASTIALYVVVGLALALAIDLLVELTRHGLPAPPRRGGGPSGPGGGSRSVLALTRGRFLSQSMMSIAVVAAGVARDHIRRARRRLEETVRLRAELAEARLAMLRSQLNPHFLYNTLNAISALVDLDPRGVRRMIARLSELLRMTLAPSSDAEVPLARELAMLEPYLEILRIRFDGRLDASVDAAADLHDALVPPMILQPLVENAMKHAVSKTAARSRIVIAARQLGDALVLSVDDSGPGESNGAEPMSDDTSGGVGLRNTRARLREIYGDDFSLDVSRTDAGGTAATIRLPFHTTADLRAMPVGHHEP